jgi:hypothetical protein
MTVMMHYDEIVISGTYTFDGRAAMKGYALNKMCYSFNKAKTARNSGKTKRPTAPSRA